jgi:L-ascorbate metabolism protein UlaG (beta-lactamase superfamily)
MKVHFHGHACFEIEHGPHRLIIDPFFTANPLAKVRAEEVKVDYILVTHGHDDHFGEDTLLIARENDATVIAPHEMAVWLGWQGVKAHGMAVGGSYAFAFGRVKMTPAWHGSGLALPEQQQLVYMGSASGFLLELGSYTVYHAGDTGLFSDMRLLGLRKPVDLALLPIGDNYTMGPEDALLAAEWVRAKQVVPMHYNTWPIIQQDAHAFVRELAQTGIKGTVLEAGQSLLFPS